MSAQEKEKQNLCMNTHDEHEKLAVMITVGASETAASAAGKQAEDIAIVGQRYIRVVDGHGMESWAKFQMLCNRVWCSLDTRWCSDTQSKEVTCKNNSNGYRTFLRQQRVLPPGSLGKKEHRSECTTTSVRISDAEHVTNGTPDRPSTMTAPIGCGEHEEELVGLKERIEEEPRHKLRDPELEIQEADVPRVPAEP